MTQSSPIPSDKRIVDAMIQLARAAKSHRIVAASPYSAEVFRELHRRGYPRVTTTKTNRVRYGQYDVALVAWQEHSIKALEATLNWLVHFLSTAGVLVVWVGPHERMLDRTLRPVLKSLGFRIESGTSCENGIAIAARRLDSVPAATAA